MFMNYKKLQFTLIELLIVITIILILAALLLPLLSRAKIKARKAVCISQLRQFVIAAQAYSIDYKGQYPTRNQRGGYPHQIKRTSNFKYDLNPHFVKPYIESKQMFNCPGQDPINSTGDDVVWSTYQYFVWADNAHYWKVPQPNLKSPDKVIKPSEAALWSCKLQNRKNVPKPIHPNTGDLIGQNAGMNDGSSKWFRPDKWS